MKRESTTFTSREFNQDTARAKRATKEGPVFITDRGAPAHVLLEISDYRKLIEPNRSLHEMLAMEEDIDLESFLPNRKADPCRELHFD